MVKARYFPTATKGILLDNGVIVFYFEETRLPTEEEKIKRTNHFEKEWMELERKSKESIPKMEKSVEEGSKEAMKEAKKHPILGPLFPFFKIVPKFFSGIVKVGMEIAKTEGKRYFVNQPVVTKAGFIFSYPDGKEEEMLLSLEETYGPEEWMRMPNDAVNIQVSNSGRLLGIETEKGGILLFEYDQTTGKYLELGRVEGSHPFGFSADDKYMFVTLEEGLYRIDILPPPDWRDKRYVISPHRPLKEVKIEIEKGIAVTDVILHGDYLLLLTWSKLYVYDVINEKIHREFKIRGYGGKSMILGPSGNVFVAGMDMSTVVRIDTNSWRIYDFVTEDHFALPRKYGVYFHKLASISPDERYVAALYDPGLIPPPNAKSWSGGTIDESRLFIWDVKERRVVVRSDERLESITGGFGYQAPAYFTKDWKYALLRMKDRGMELLELRK